MIDKQDLMTREISMLKALAQIASMVILLMGASAHAVPGGGPNTFHVDGDEVQSVLSFKELMQLSDAQREDYLVDLQNMLLETGAISHVFGGRLIAEFDLSPHRTENILKLLSALQSNAFARGSIPQDACGPGYSSDDSWAAGVLVCRKTEQVRNGRATNTYPITDESKCAGNPGHVIVAWGSSSMCVRDSDYTKLRDKNLLATWNARLSPESAKRTNRVKEGEEPTPAQRDASTQAYDEQKRAADAKKKLEGDLKADKGIDPVTDKDLKDPNQCVVRDAKNSKAWQSEREAYLREPDKRAEAMKTKTCIYAGWMRDFRSAAAKNGEIDVKNTACIRPKSEESYGDLKISCAKGQILCNPMIFGIASMSGNSAKGVCANPASNATKQCGEQFDSLRAAKGTKRNGRQPAAGTVAPAAPAVDDPATAAGATKKFFTGNAQGLQEGWNQLGKQMGDFCKAGSKTRKLHCHECQVIGQRLADARAGLAKSLKEERGPTAVAPGPAKK